MISTPPSTSPRRVLFVLKHREDPYNTGNWNDRVAPDRVGKELSSGLSNSARFVQEMLARHGIASKMVHVADNNGIHREIVEFGATDCIVEAFWVVPDKFVELHRACPNVRFIVRNHSEMAFLAGEGIGLEWTLAYADLPSVAISCNAPRALDDVRLLVAAMHPDWSDAEVAATVPYLPNYYPIGHRAHAAHPTNVLRKRHVDVGCFGAIRPLKNQVPQAIAALRFAGEVGKSLRFHINGGRQEMHGAPILKNLRALFDRYPRHELVEHPWMDHAEFCALVAQMDVLSQVSFSETFNIVAADAVSQNVPTVTSPEIAWASPRYFADPTSTIEIAEKLFLAYQDHIRTDGRAVQDGLIGLERYNRDSEREWLDLFGR